MSYHFAPDSLHSCRAGRLESVRQYVKSVVLFIGGVVDLHYVAPFDWESYLGIGTRQSCVDHEAMFPLNLISRSRDLCATTYMSPATA